MAKLDRLEQRASRFQPDLRNTREVAEELGFKHQANFYTFCRRNKIKCAAGLVDVNQVYAVWKTD